MLNKFTLARPYAKAFFSALKEAGQVEQGLKTLQCLSCFVQAPAVMKVVRNNSLSSVVLEDFFRSLVDAVLKLSEIEVLFIHALSEHKRLFVLSEILVLYQDYQSADSKKIFVEVTSAQKLNQDQEKGLLMQLEKRFSKTVVMKQEIAPALLGGLLIRAGNRVIDLTLLGKLKQLEQNLLEV
jgi:F-type H+-transporting ATPase subunit delta